MTKHIILIGFKHVGKTAVGQLLAQKQNRPFIDLDQTIVTLHGKALTCRQIMQTHGETFFRELEHHALEQVLLSPPSIISIGGGAGVKTENQQLMKPHIIIHITAPRDTVFARILSNGHPAFVPENVDPHQYLIDLWEKRIPIFEKIAAFTVYNDKTLEETVNTLLDKLHQDNNS